MLLGFKRRFAPFVENGSKTHTIRGERKIPPKVGEVCHCYVDPRQKTMRLLGRWPCVKVEHVEIREWILPDPEPDLYAIFSVIINGISLTEDERDALAWRDGFRDGGHLGAFGLMMRFWIATHRRRSRDSYRYAPLRFSGHIIHWDYKHPVEATQKQEARA